jgi:hypothetical protein
MYDSMADDLEFRWASAVLRQVRPRAILGCVNIRRLRIVGWHSPLSIWKLVAVPQNGAVFPMVNLSAISTFPDSEIESDANISCRRHVMIDWQQMLCFKLLSLKLYSLTHLGPTSLPSFSCLNSEFMNGSYPKILEC